MRVRFLLLILPLALVGLSPVEGRAAVQKTLLRLGAIEQWVNLAYYYTDSSGDRASSESTSHTFDESYTLKGKYAILYPRLWHGEFKLDLGMEQESRSRAGGRRQDDSNELTLDYRLNGILFAFKPVSVGFATSSNNLRRVPGTGPDYDIRSNRHQLAVNWKNRLFPSRLSIAHSTSATQGLDLDRTITSDQLELRISNHVGRSETDFLARTLKTSTDFSGAKRSSDLTRTEFDLDNRLVLGSGVRSGRLLSRFGFLDESGATDNQRLTVGEDLAWRLGKALTTGASYTFTTTESSSSADRFDNQGQSVEGFLEHQLARSLTTRIVHSRRWEDGSNGTEEQWLTDLNVNYRKQLPAAALLSLNVGYAVGGTEREFFSGERVVIDERKRVLTDAIPLDDPGIIAATLVVFNADRSVEYREGVDYLVRNFGLNTELELLAGGAISIGEIVSLDYRYEITSVDAFDTVTYRSTGSLSLRAGRLLFWYNFSDSKQRSSGSDTRSNLNDTLQVRLGVNARQGGHNFRFTLGHFDSPTAPYDYVEAQWAYHRPLFRGIFDLRANESYTWYRDADVGGITARGINRIFVSSQYTRRWLNHLLATRALYSSTQDGKDQQRLRFEGDYSVLVGRTSLSLLAGVEWNMLDESSGFSRYASIRVQRTF